MKVYTLQGGTHGCGIAGESGQDQARSERTLAYARDLTIDLAPYSVAVVEIVAE